YKGMPDFITPSSPEKGIAFWLAARLTVATALCVTSFMPTAPLRKPQTSYAQLLGYALYTLLIYWIVLFHESILPRTFIEGQGLTHFKVVCEWGIIGLLGIAASRFWRRAGNNAETHNLNTYFFAAAVVFMMSEGFFTQYKTTSDAFNVLGHLYKIIGYFLLYQAVFVSTIQAPYHEIEQQQTRYRQLFDNMTSCGAVYQMVDNGCDFIFLEVNHAAERTEKIGRDDFIGRRVTELFPGAADFGLLDVLRRVWHTGRPEHFPVKYYQDGRIAGWRENYLYRLADGNIVAVYDDVTERKLAEQALQESEKNFRVIFETAAIGMAEADPVTGKLLRVNLKFCQMTGYCAQELLSKTIEMITHPDDREQYMDGWRRMARGDDPEYVTEKRYIHKDGHEIWAHLNVVALRDENGVILRTLAAIADITARKQAETDRRRYDRELKSIFNALPDFYFRLGSDGTILSYHARPTVMAELYEPSEQLIGRRMIDVLPPAQMALFAAKLKEQQSSGKIITFEYQLTGSAGERYYEARLANLADSGDIIVLVRDIVERKQLEQQLQQAQKMEALGQLTGGIAHDFNNILAAILGYSNLALERCVSDPSDKLARYLGEVISASERARDLIAKMLAYSRTSSVMTSVPLDMVSEVEKAVAMLSVAIPAGIEVATHIAPDVPSVRIDPIEVQQVLINLAVNSRDAIGEQGRIDITLERARIKRRVCAICHNIIEGDYVALEVKDSGNGIPANVQQRIFDPFFTTKDIGKGSGLGLSMVQGVVIKNNAHVLIETKLGQGTAFRLLFPFADAAAVSSAIPISAPLAPITECWRIWVVEDQESLAGYYLELLQEQGYRVSVFTDPAKALRAFRLDPDSVDLILTDQTMPHLSGAELACAVLAVKPELPVILVTGYSERINADEAKRLGIRCYLNKPVDGNKLLDILAAELCKNDVA
ncbi:MAG: MASE3 domain-containing protein, partial [Methylobacter sp.]